MLHCSKTWRKVRVIDSHEEISKMNKLNEAAIRQRAYEIWENSGRPHGRDAEHWHQAAAEVINLEAQVDMKAPVAKAAKKPLRAAAAAVAPSPVRRKK